MAGASFGHAGGSFTGGHDTSWAANDAVAQKGREGEERIGRLLAGVALDSNGAVVLHDLTVPIPGMRINIDHALVAGAHVLPVDAKTWQPGFYVTIGGKTYRSGRRFTAKDRTGKTVYPAEKSTMQMIDTSLRSFVSPVTGAAVDRGLVAVVPSSARKRLSVAFLRLIGAKAVTEKSLHRRAERFVRTHGRADAELVGRLRELVRDDDVPLSRPAGRRPPRK